MQPPLPSVTQTWRNDTYPAISPTREELSVKGKTVVITGAGSGIGRETCLAFAAAGAAQIVLLGRTRTSLAETASLLPPSLTSKVFPVDLTEEEAILYVAASIGQWDILVLAAGYCPDPAAIGQSSTTEWWQGFETNVKGNFVPTHAFLPTANPTHAAVLAVTTGTTALPTAMLPGLSSYISSKLAQTKLIEFLAAENPNIFAVTVHPGMVETAIFTKSGAKAEALPMDKVQLPAHFMVWLASPEAAFLSGRSVWANWDVEELRAQSSDIQNGPKLISGVIGWPYGS